MAIVQEVIIEVKAEDKALDPLITKLEKTGELSKEQANQFLKDSQRFVDASKKREQALKEEIQDLNELKSRKRQAFDPTEIKEYNKRIRETEQRVKSLGGQVKRSNTEFNAVENTLKNLGRTLIAVFAVERIRNFTNEAIRLQREFQ